MVWFKPSISPSLLTTTSVFLIFTFTVICQSFLTFTLAPSWLLHRLHYHNKIIHIQQFPYHSLRIFLACGIQHNQIQENLQSFRPTIISISCMFFYVSPLFSEFLVLPLRCKLFSTFIFRKHQTSTLLISYHKNSNEKQTPVWPLIPTAVSNPVPFSFIDICLSLSFPVAFRNT